MANKSRPICCECTPVGETRFGGERGRPPSQVIVEAVAAVEGIIPEEMALLKSPSLETYSRESTARYMCEVSTGVHAKFKL